jgi:type IV secretory pathway VirB2 component (pilin)
MSTTVTPEQGSSQELPERTEKTASTVNLNHRDPAQGTSPTTSTQSSRANRQTPAGQRPTQRISHLLGQRTGLSRVMLVVLTGALIFGLIGFAAHIMWVVAIIIIALGLGYVAAGSRRDRTDAVNRRQEDDLDTARRD